MIVELTRRGKLITGEPYFMPGTPIVVDRKGLGDAGPGDLVSVTPGRGRARVERVIGSAKRIENVLEALLVEEGLREGFEPHDVAEPSFEGRSDLRELTEWEREHLGEIDIGRYQVLPEPRCYVNHACSPNAVSMNQGLMIARSSCWKAVTNVRSSVLRRPGMIEWA